MDNKKKIIAVVLAAALAAAIVIAIAAVKTSRSNTAPNSTTTQSEEKATPEAKSEDVKTEENAADKETKTENNTGSTASSSTASEEAKVTPTFMYFISESDDGYEQTKAMLKELQSEYGDRVNFDIVNVDENPDAKKNFPVDGQTPALIMLNTSNDISGLEFKCSDKERLVKDIENALK